MTSYTTWKQAMEFIRANPGRTCREIAEGIGVKPQSLSRELTRCTRNGTLRRKMLRLNGTLVYEMNPDDDRPLPDAAFFIE